MLFKSLNSSLFFVLYLLTAIQNATKKSLIFLVLPYLTIVFYCLGGVSTPLKARVARDGYI